MGPYGDPFREKIVEQICFLTKARRHKKIQKLYTRPPPLKKLTKLVAVKPHGLIFFPEGSIFRAGSDPSVKKMPRPHLMKSVKSNGAKMNENIPAS